MSVQPVDQQVVTTTTTTTTTTVVAPAGAPVVAVMDRGPRGIGHLQPMPNVLIKQTRRGCIQELFGCEAKNEFNIATIENPNSHFMYSLEESTCCMRFCCKNQRAFTQTVWMGNGVADDTQKVMSMQKGWTCPLQACNCYYCFDPYLDFADAQGGSLGKVKVPFFCCIPQFVVSDEEGKPEYHIHMPTCCGGVCIDCCAEGCCNCKIPFYIYEAGQKDRARGKEIGKIIKLWRGLGTEMFSDADTFSVEFPANATAPQKARVFGTTFLINMVFFERQNDGGGAGS